MYAWQNNGVHTSMYRKTKIMLDSWGYKTTILAAEPNHELNGIGNILRYRGLLGAEIIKE